MSPFMEVIEEKIALMAIIFFFTVLGLMMIEAEEEPLIITSIGTFILLLSLIAEIVIVVWILVSIQKWRKEKQARKTKQ